ncbi:MAG: AF1514 family protein [Desulfomonile tiedjei]|nr:AF1514 family protein [Desulfomonile tiedjei]
MFDCKFITREMLADPIEVRTKDKGELTFYDAKAIADRRAKELTTDPVLLSWFDKKSGRYAPDVTCCGTEKPTWLVYAESRGGRYSVDINDEDYVFVYREGLSGS